MSHVVTLPRDPIATAGTTTAQGWLDRAVQAHRAGQLLDAEHLYRQALQVEPANADALHMLGVLASQCGQQYLAAGYIQEALFRQPDHPFCHSNLGIALREQGKLEEAAVEFREALRLKPDYAEAHLNLGNVLRELGSHLEAVDHYRCALRFRPDYAKVHYNLGHALLELGKTEAAAFHHREAVRLQPDPSREAFVAGLAAQAAGRLEEAASLYRQAVTANPDLTEAQIHLGNVLRQQARSEEAVAHLQDALRRAPHNAALHSSVGLLFRELDRLRDSVTHFRQAVRLRPNHPESLLNLGSALASVEEAEQAIPHFEKALALKPGYAKAHNNLGSALHALGRMAEAERHLQEALRLEPDYAGAHANLGTVLVELGWLARAEEHFRASLRLEPAQPNALAQLATLLRGRLPDDDRQVLDRLVAENRVGRSERMALLFAAAHVCDGRGEYPAAARHLEEANALALEDAQRQGRSYDPADYSRYIDAVMAACTPAFFERLRGHGLDTELPVFIVGLPRSGTTLVEQVLASHPQVYGAGELPHAHEAAASVPAVLGLHAHPWHCMDRLDGPAVQQIAEKYLGRLEALACGAARLVDKMPDNYSVLGLIAVLFPRARIIHCRRDLRDVAVSCWSVHFHKVQWANAFDPIASRCADYRRIMEHWRQTLPLPMLEIDYEETVHDLEGVARQLVAWCGLEWDPACLAFHKTERPVRTASASQVREPIYRRSLARWKNYENELAALFARLPNP